jgi:hypothetical protein
MFFELVAKPKTALRKSKYHAKGEVYYENCNMDAEYYRKNLRKIGTKIRAYYKKIHQSHVRVKLQIDSAGGHGLAVGHGNFDKFAAMMLKDFNVELVQQPGNTPMYNILDLKMWRCIQVEVDKMDEGARHREPELVEVVKQAWKNTPLRKILTSFEWRRDVAQEATETEGWCPHEGKEGKGHKRVYEDTDYAELRKMLKID